MGFAFELNALLAFSSFLLFRALRWLFKLSLILDFLFGRLLRPAKEQLIEALLDWIILVINRQRLEVN